MGGGTVNASDKAKAIADDLKIREWLAGIPEGREPGAAGMMTGKITYGRPVGAKAAQRVAE